VFIFIAIYLPLNSRAADLKIEPSLELRVEYDDNLDFDDNDEVDDFAGNAITQLRLDYVTELSRVSLIGKADVLRYFNETDFDRENFLLGLDGGYLMSDRWSFAGNFKFRKDETIDSQLEETGQAFDRNAVETYDAAGGLFYQLTELSDIGFNTEYRKRNYDSDDDTDFDRYTFSLPYTKRFANQRDMLKIVPAYTIFDSDGEEDATDYRLGFGWERLVTETVTFTLDFGGRYTIIEDKNGEDDDNLGYFGQVSFEKRGETFLSEIGASRDIRANSDGNIVEVNRVFLNVNKRLLERFRFRFYGAGYLSDEESDNVEEEDKTRYFEVRPSFLFLITENHSLELAYQYQNAKEFDRPGNPITQRNKVWLGLQLKFPKN
jgi:hypothetical protein